MRGETKVTETRTAYETGSPVVFLDTETTGLSLDDDIWEFAAIKRFPDGHEEAWQRFVRHDPYKCCRLPEFFADDHRRRYRQAEAIEPEDLAELVENLTDDRPHVVGAVPNFDTERLARLLAAHGRKPGWHYHLIDVENLAVGYLSACIQMVPGSGQPGVSLPWDSDALSRAVGIEPPGEGERHTALGDVMWVRAIYDRVTGAQIPKPYEEQS